MPGPEDYQQHNPEYESMMPMQPEAMVDEEVMMNIDDVVESTHDHAMDDVMEGNMPEDASTEELSQFPEEPEYYEEEDFSVPEEAAYDEVPTPAFDTEMPSEEEDIEEEPGNVANL